MSTVTSACAALPAPVTLPKSLQ